GEESGERRMTRTIAEPPVCRLAQLIESFVVLVKRVEERDRIGGVDEHRKSEPTCPCDEGDDSGVIRCDERISAIAHLEPKVLPDFHAACAAPCAIGELLQ